MKKVLFAMIVPFWKRETGAQQRIFSMVKALASHGYQVRIFFPGHAEPSDHLAAEQLELNVAFCRSDEPVAGVSLAQKIKWQIEAVKHAVRNVSGAGGKKNEQSEPLRLSDFRWPWAEAAFKNLVFEFDPEVIVCEYITMAYLVKSLPEEIRSKVHCMVDTHDLLSQRQKEFANHGRAHWISVSPEEEAVALGCFDTIIAIQEDEAAAFQAMVPASTVMVVGHQPLVAKMSDTEKRNDWDVITLGYLGSNNASNVDAINKFLDVVWRNFQDAPVVRLVLAGDVSSQVQTNLQSPNVELLGRVGHVDDFYEQVDVVINPVGYGTGLKIKSVEAIAYGKPLLSTTAGWIGDPPGGVTVVDHLEQMTDVIKNWSDDSVLFDRIRQAARSSARQGSDQIYGPLLERL